MIRKIIDNKLAELHQKEIDDAELAKKKAIDHQKAISKIEEDIVKLLDLAQIDSFKIPNDTYTAILIFLDSHHYKGDFKKTYSIKLGYSLEDLDGEINTALTAPLGEITITMPSIFSNFDFSDLFKAENPVVTKGNEYVIFTFM